MECSREGLLGAKAPCPPMCVKLKDMYVSPGKGWMAGPWTDRLVIRRQNEERICGLDRWAHGSTHLVDLWKWTTTLLIDSKIWPVFSILKGSIFMKALAALGLRWDAIHHRFMAQGNMWSKSQRAVHLDLLPQSCPSAEGLKSTWPRPEPGLSPWRRYHMDPGKRRGTPLKLNSVPFWYCSQCPQVWHSFFSAVPA